MNKRIYRMVVLMLVAIASMALIGCGEKSDKPVAPQQSASVSEVQTTVVTDENYGLAESEIIFAGTVQKIADATGTNGTGEWLHLREGVDPKDRKIMRVNFDTLYSSVVVDLTEDAVLTMPETNGRYQSAWLITDEHYNPMAFVEPGTYTLTQENVGSRYVAIAVRTQVNVTDPADLAIVHELQDQLKLEQNDKGAFVPSGNWDMDEVLAMRTKYMEIGDTLSTDVMFGKKGEVSLRDHNAGTAFGWGGFTPDQAVYPQYFPTSTAHQTLLLKDVPVKAFWSITVYDGEGYPQTETYNINSAFAVPEEDGSVVINFGGDKNAKNYMETFDGWNFTLRMYQPTEAYFNGEWVIPKLELEK